jgi:fucose permease
MNGVLRPVTEVAISSAFIFGMVAALWGSLKLTLTRSLNLGEGHVGSLLTAFNLALAPMMLLSGVLIDTWGVRPVVILSSTATAASLFALSYGPAVSRSFAAVLLGGLGAAGLCTGAIVLMPEALFPQEPTPSLNMGIVFIAVGALVAPVFADVAIRVIGYPRAMAILASLCLVPGVFALLSGTEDLAAGNNDPTEVITRHSLWLAALVLVLYTPLEASISFWATTYLTEHGTNERRANWLLTGFWATFLASRLIVAALMHGRYLRPEWSAWILVLPALMTAVILGNMAGTVDAGRAARGVLLLGFCLGPIFPTLVGMVYEQLSQAEVHCEGTAFGTLFAAGSFGSLLFGPIIGAAVNRRSMQAALRIPMIGALLLTAAALVFGLAAER